MAAEAMTRKKIAAHRQELCRILNTIEDEGERLEALKELAKKVGVGSMRKGKVLIKQDIYGEQKYQEADLITEGELVLNINNALQTDTMVDMCTIAARNSWVAIIATIIALISALAAWSAIVKMVR